MHAGGYTPCQSNTVSLLCEAQGAHKTHVDKISVSRARKSSYGATIVNQETIISIRPHYLFQFFLSGLVPWKFCHR